MLRKETSSGKNGKYAYHVIDHSKQGKKGEAATYAVFMPRAMRTLPSHFSIMGRVILSIDPSRSAYRVCVQKKEKFK